MSARLVTLTLRCHQAFLHFQKREIERSNDVNYPKAKSKIQREIKEERKWGLRFLIAKEGKIQ